MKRREFITLLGAAAALAAGARMRSNRASACGASACFTAAATETIRAYRHRPRRSNKRCSSWDGPTAET